MAKRWNSSSWRALWSKQDLTSGVEPLSCSWSRWWNVHAFIVRYTSLKCHKPKYFWRKVLYNLSIRCFKSTLANYTNCLMKKTKKFTLLPGSMSSSKVNLTLEIDKKSNFSPTSWSGVAGFYNAWRRRQGKLDLSKRKYELFSNRASSKHFQASYKSQKKKSRS